MSAGGFESAATIPATPAWALQVEPEAPAAPRPEPMPSLMRSAGIAFDRAHTLARPTPSRARTGARLAAFAVDAGIVLAFAAATLGAGAAAFGAAELRAAGHGSLLAGAAHVATAEPATAMAVALVVLLLASAYAIYFVGVAGRTPGMARGGFRVVRDDGNPLTLLDAVSRWGGVLLATLPLGLGFLWARVDAEGKGLHDRLSGTRLVNR